MQHQCSQLPAFVDRPCELPAVELPRSSLSCAVVGSPGFWLSRAADMLPRGRDFLWMSHWTRYTQMKERGTRTRRFLPIPTTFTQRRSRTTSFLGAVIRLPRYSLTTRASASMKINHRAESEYGRKFALIRVIPVGPARPSTIRACLAQSPNRMKSRSNGALGSHIKEFLTFPSAAYTTTFRFCRAILPISIPESLYQRLG